MPTTFGSVLSSHPFSPLYHHVTDGSPDGTTVLQAGGGMQTREMKANVQAQQHLYFL